MFGSAIWDCIPSSHTLEDTRFTQRDFFLRLMKVRARIDDCTGPDSARAERILSEVRSLLIRLAGLNVRVLFNQTALDDYVNVPIPIPDQFVFIDSDKFFCLF